MLLVSVGSNGFSMSLVRVHCCLSTRFAANWNGSLLPRPAVAYVLRAISAEPSIQQIHRLRSPVSDPIIHNLNNLVCFHKQHIY